jgi:SPP1 family predicted phage head-tail adaptor
MSSSRDSIGKLRDQVTIETPSDSLDSIGGQTVSWATHVQVYADVKAISARERLFAEKLEGNTTHRVRIRYLSTVTTSMRITFGSRTLQIRGVVHEEQNSRWTDLLCEEGVAS